ncbi:MAG: hypothetical protein R3351_01715 [Nitrospirales bacterium]|nr:hypothetical protein [Nitrospirales bacterium]
MTPRKEATISEKNVIGTPPSTRLLRRTSKSIVTQTYVTLQKKNTPTEATPEIQEALE